MIEAKNRFFDGPYAQGENGLEFMWNAAIDAVMNLPSYDPAIGGDQPCHPEEARYKSISEIGRLKP
jgi:hypothetical protein